MTSIIVLICLICIVCRQSRIEGNGEQLLERKRAARNPYLHPSDLPEGEKFFYLMGAFIREVAPIVIVILVKSVRGLGWLCVGIAWTLLWLFLVTVKLLGIAWRKFDSFCRDQMDPNWKIDEMEAQAQAAINLYKGNLQAHRQEKIRKIEEQKLLAEAKQIAMAWEIEKVKRLSKEQLGLLAEQFAALSDWADGEFHKQQMVASHCPHCGKKVLLARTAANKIVKCPYRECRGRIKVDFNPKVFRCPRTIRV